MGATAKMLNLSVHRATTVKFVVDEDNIIDEDYDEDYVIA